MNPAEFSCDRSGFRFPYTNPRLPNTSPGSITAVKPHEAASGKPDETIRYEVSVKVGNTLYVVLYEPPPGTDIVQYQVGTDLRVSVGSNTLTFNRRGGGGEAVVPILERQALPNPSRPQLSDLEKTDFFSARLDPLTEMLTLSPNQQAQVKPILEQEAGELAEMRGNPVVSKKTKLDRLQKVVLESDKKMKPILSGQQKSAMAEAAGSSQATEGRTQETS